MSTSYTSNLGLAKPATGETGWGTTINDSTTTMIEEAIAGKATINSWSTDSHTLTENNGASSEARAAILHCTDTGGQISGATANVIVPAKTKLYCVINETGHNVLVKTSSGTGITVPTGKIINLTCDGTNVVEQSNYNVNLNASTITSTSSVTCETFKIDATSSVVVGSIKDEDDMSSNSSIALATQQSIKAYTDNNGEFYTPEIIIPWSGISSTSTVPGFITVTNSDTTVAEFSVPGTSDSDWQAIDLSAQYSLYKTDAGEGLVEAILTLQRKTKVTTGLLLGTVAVVPAQRGGSSSHFFEVALSGDFRNKIDSSTKISANNGSSGAKDVVSYTYDSGTDRTLIVYNNGASSAGSSFAGVGDSVYYAVDGYESAGTWLDVETVQQAGEYLSGGSMSPVGREVRNMPRMLVKNSNSALTEFRLRARTSANTDQLLYYKTYVSTVNIRRG